MDVMTAKDLLTKEEIEKAYEVLRPIIKRTPLQHDTYLSQKYHCNVYLKREDLQAVRSFKIRGAYYAISQTPAAVRQRGVVCASAGNHAQGVAWTCHKLQIPAVIFMPVTTPRQKVDQVKFFGGSAVTIKLTGDTFDAAAQAAANYCEEKQLTFIAPFDDKHTMAGQGTIACEIFEDAAAHDVTVDYLFAAIGGGGLISGLAAYTKNVSSATKVIGVEPTGAASMAAAFKCGHPLTLEHIDKFVDGAAVKTAGQLTYNNAKKYVDQLVNVAEGHVCTTLLELYSKEAIVAEPAGALSVAALEEHQAEISGKTVVCVISGGNNDIERMQEIKERSLVYEGYQCYFIVNFPQRPGALREMVSEILDKDDDITKFEYTKKVNRGKGPVLIGIRLGKRQNIRPLQERLRQFDPYYIDLKENQMLYEMMV
ncbi:threonine ammonia-lyase IlvA [Liquorilactobacillus satsumensis]|uniref:L-threonine dehydratase n=1 Tax=Liquorilactobacillus satsumensis DSM 16230 = JCM 12392 TaxID=1423801 RepID=A0A0R1UUD2_9LACO|nr:threonine ammonia-lyase IlvA [Liquorilactobacillus satsumensis]KRL96711.1 threonine dehydratase [Liquorilactobacillus satsumensis DSM 16230 = JCM 12392]